MNFNVTEGKKPLDRVLDSTLQLTFKKVHVLRFSGVREEIHNGLKRLLKHSSLFQQHVYGRLYFLQKPQPEHTTTD